MFPLWIPLPPWLNTDVYFLLLLSLVVLSVLLLAAPGRRWLLRAVEPLVGRVAPGVQQGVLERVRLALESLNVLSRGPDSLQLIFWTVLTWGSGVVTNYLVLRALAIDVPPIAAVFVLALLQIGLALPSLPATIGVFEYTCVLALSVFAVEQSAALSFGLLLHGLVLIPTVVGLLLFWGSGLSLASLQGWRRRVEGGTEPKIEI